MKRNWFFAFVVYRKLAHICNQAYGRPGRAPWCLCSMQDETCLIAWVPFWGNLLIEKRRGAKEIWKSPTWWDMYCRKACSRTTLIPLIVAPLAMFLGRSDVFSPFKYSITQLVIGAANPFGASHAGSASNYIGMIIQLVVSERPVI
jgi:hypothetical protein